MISRNSIRVFLKCDYMKNNLFNLDSIKKYINKFTLTPNKRVKLERYIERVHNNEFKGETKGYLAFLKLLEDILDYEEDIHIKFDDNVDIGRDRVEFALKDENGKFMVIELKGSNVDLDKPQNRVNDKRTPVKQAFGYAEDSTKQTGLVSWILVSNYKEFRLYHYENRAGEYISFNIDDLLNEEKFKYFMFAFSKESHIDSKIINDVIEEVYIEKTKLATNFYKLFNETRLMIYKELNELHGMDKEDAISYAQTIVDRFIFICFASSRELLPRDIARKTLLDRIKTENLRDYNVWRELNYLFKDVNKGREDREISGYNGGLFNKNLKDIKLQDIIKDKEFFKNVYQKWDFKEFETRLKKEVKPSTLKRLNPIYINLLIITYFDFSEEKKESNTHRLDIDILGHIFENSIGDIEEIKADSKGRRKKDGIFYTPDYITEYICKNTIIPYLSLSGKSNTVEDLLQEYSIGREVEKLDQKIKDIRIVDPACGSGAFLNKATDILLDIHKGIFDIKKRYTTSESMRVGKGKRRKTENIKFTDLGAYVFDALSKRREILLDNIYGVDLNSESVEITKLSLFLKVCEKDKMLPDLDKNIQCGNSLIDDISVTDKAFDWNSREGFKEILDNGGFDIVIGNPPYVGEKGNKDVFRKIKSTEWGNQFYEGKMDLFYFFFHKAIDLTRENGFISFITTNYFITADGGLKLRKDLKSRTIITKLINFDEFKIFDNALGQHNMITFLIKSNNKESFAHNSVTSRKGCMDSNISNEIMNGNDELTQYYTVAQDNLFEGDKYYIRLEGTTESRNDINSIILNKIKNNSDLLGEICYINAGADVTISKITNKHLKNFDGNFSMGDGVFVLSQEEISSLTLNSHEKIILKDYIKSSNIKKYSVETTSDKLIYLTWEDDISKFPTFEGHLSRFKEILEDQVKRYNENYPWFALHRPREKDIFESKEKILVPYRSKCNVFGYSESPLYSSRDVFFIRTKDENYNLKYILTLLNSKLFYMWLYFKGKRKGQTLELYGTPLSNIPIKLITKNVQKQYIEKADKMIQFNNDLIDEINGFKSWLQRDPYNMDKFSKKLDKYYELSFNDFLSELKKKDVDIRRKKTQELLKDEFDQSLKVINDLLQKINETDSEINKMVYDLYGLSLEEIQIIEDF